MDKIERKSGEHTLQHLIISKVHKSEPVIKNNVNNTRRRKLYQHQTVFTVAEQNSDKADEAETGVRLAGYVDISLPRRR